MGLDQYAYAVKKGKITKAVDFNLDGIDSEDIQSDFCYWRKHHDLQGWMEDLYIAKGGSSEFNCSMLLLTEEDINALELALNERALPETTGFFFGSGNTEGYVDHDRDFILRAREAMRDGYDIVYDSWW